MNAEARKVVELFKRKPKKKLAIDIPEREFLGPGLELIATPPSPVKIRLMFAICALFTLALALSWFFRVDIYAVARAKIQPAGRSKVIQPIETGRVVKMHVVNGSHVGIGDVLIELDPTQTSADHSATASQVAALSAEIARREAAIVAANARQFGSNRSIAFARDIPPTVRLREQSVLNADLLQLKFGLDALDARIAERDAKKAAVELTKGELERLIVHLREGVDMRKSLQQKGLESMANVIDAEQALGREMTGLASQQGEILQADAAIQSLYREKDNSIAKFINDNVQARVAAQTRLESTEQDLVKSSARVENTRLVAPIAGTVQELVVTTIGQVVTAGQQLMSLVPEKANLEVEALVENRDIGFIEVGQLVVLKVDAFPYTRFGTIPGKVVRISRDAVASDDVAATPGISPPSAAAAAAAQATPRTQNLVYPVTVELDRSAIVVGGQEVALAPGMTGAVEIRTGDRRVIDYLLAPIVEVTTESAHER